MIGPGLYFYFQDDGGDFFLKDETHERSSEVRHASTEYFYCRKHVKRIFFPKPEACGSDFVQNSEIEEQYFFQKIEIS
jgi:hypothetical protein